MLEYYFLFTEIPDNIETGTYIPYLVILSYIVAVFASYIALDFATYLRVEKNKLTKRLLHWGGSFSMGAGIWSMHFIGMLAYKMDMFISYDTFLTAFSLVVAIWIAYFVLFFVKYKNLTFANLSISSILLGIGICTMHYTGMAAMNMDGILKYTPGLFSLSVLIAMSASFAALLIISFLAKKQRKYHQTLKIIAAMVMGIAICGMHYTGVAASVFIPFADCRYDTEQSFTGLALSIAGVTFVVLGVTLVLGSYIFRSKDSKKINSKIFYLPVFLSFIVSLIITILSFVIIENQNNKEASSIFKANYVSINNMLESNLTHLQSVVENLPHNIIHQSIDLNELSELTAISAGKIIGVESQYFIPLRLLDSIENYTDNNNVLSANILKIIKDTIEQNKDSKLSFSTEIIKHQDNNSNVSLLIYPIEEKEGEGYIVASISFINILNDIISRLDYPIQASLLNDLSKAQDYENLLLQDKNIALANRKFTIRYQASIDAYKHFAWLKYTTLFVGLTITFLLSGYVYLTLRQYKIGYKIRRELEEKNRYLETHKAELTEAKEQLHTIVSTAADAIISIDDIGIVGTFNHAAEDMFGYKASEVIGNNITMLMPEKYAVDHSSHLKNYAEGNGVGFVGAGRGREVEATRKNGDRFPILLSVGGSKTGGGTVFTGVIRDITKQKEAENALIEAKETAEIANMAKQNFVANMSHEIRTPLNGIIGLTGLLARTSLSEKQVSFVNTMRKSSETLLWLINDILDFAKIEAGQLTLEPIPFNLQVTVNDIVETFSAEAHKKNIELVVRHKPKMTHHVIGDPGRIRQIITNLIGNSLKFTEKGYIFINVDCKEEHEKEIILEIYVEDTGIGIAPEKQKQIFERFTQAEDATSRKYGGTGLGLSISCELVSLMGGDISLDSAEGKGSTFTFTLKLEKDINREGYKNTNVDNILAGKKVLVIDDMPLNLQIFAEIIKSEKAIAVVANSGKQALEILDEKSTITEPFDVILVDGRLEDMDGITLGKHISDKLPNQKMIIHTSIGQKGDTTKYQNVGFSTYLSKPFTHKDFIDIVSYTILFPEKGKKNQQMITRHLIKEIYSDTLDDFTREQMPEDFKILVAEDDLVNQKVITALMEELGCNFTIVDNGKQAVDICEKEVFNLILMDMNMPEMDGVEATIQIRKHEKEENRDAIPIVALTAHALKEHKDACIAAGMNEYLSKPVTLEKIEQQLQKWAIHGSCKQQVKNEELADNDTINKNSIIDIVFLDEITGNDKELQKELFEIFLRDAQKSLDTLIEEGLATVEWKKAAHKLKGSALSLGANKLSKSCANAENSDASGDRDALLFAIQNGISEVRQFSKDTMNI